jgi:hippurate hydrolase
MTISPVLQKKALKLIDSQALSLVDLYRRLHAHPELSGQEVRTARQVAEELSAAGCNVATGVGGHGVVGVIENGPGPVLMLRADMDALPIQEETGLPYASREIAKGAQGQPVPVMHACGHDLHTTILIGAARVLAALRQDWGGSLLLVAQPAEEAIGGARLMLQDGLYSRFPRPKWALALHVDPGLAAGEIAIGPGYVTSACQSIDVTIKGRPGHGAAPHLGIDPVVLAAQFVLALQTIVSRRTDPREAVVIHVGRIEGGSSRNSMAERVVLELSLRAQGQAGLERLVAEVKETLTGLAQAAGAGADLKPELERAAVPTPSVANDPQLSGRLAGVFQGWLGSGSVKNCRPLLGSEDFSRFGEVDPPVALTLFFLGATEPELFARIQNDPGRLPRLHTPTFAPAVEPALRAGLTCFTAAGLELLSYAKNT